MNMFKKLSALVACVALALSSFVTMTPAHAAGVWYFDYSCVVNNEYWCPGGAYTQWIGPFYSYEACANTATNFAASPFGQWPMNVGGCSEF
jgi:hypothetical protein